MTVWNWFALIACIVVLVAILVFITVLAIKNKWIKDIYETLCVAIKEAEEKFPEHGSGEKKKEYVLAKIEEKCNELKIPFNILKQVITNLIKTIISNYNIISK